jgi:hypothetical protein
LVEALCYKPEGRRFDSRWGHWIFFSWPNPSSRTMAPGSTQPLTEMSTRNLPGGKGRLARKADNLTAICEPIVYKMWEPRRLTTPCYRASFSFSFYPYGYFRIWVTMLMTMKSTHFWDVTDTQTARWSHKPPFYFVQSKESSLINIRRETHIWHYDIRTDLYMKFNRNCNRPWRPIGLWGIEAPTFSR